MQRTAIRIFKTLIPKLNNNIASYSYYTNRGYKPTLYTKISPLGSPSLNLTPVLNDWAEKGHKIHFSELQRIILDLRRRKRFAQALQVSEWMSSKGNFVISPTEHAVHLDLIGKVHGYPSAEIYFNSLKELNRTDKTYGALLHCYVRQRQTDKALLHLQKMHEVGVASSPVTYNDIMCLYAKSDQYEKVYDVLTDMKKNGISPDILSYKICMNLYGVNSDIEGMENILKEMESHPNIVADWNTYASVANHYIKAGQINKAYDALKKSEERLHNKDGLGHNHLISLYSLLGNTSEVLRMWALLKSDCKRCINKDYIVMLESLARLGDFRESEKLLDEWESSGNYYDFRVPNALIIGYANKGLYDKSKDLLEDLVKKGRTTIPNTWERLATAFIEKDEMEKATYCMKTSLSVYKKNKSWKPNLKLVTSILNSLGEKGSAEDVEAFVASSRNVVPLNRQMYHALLKAYIRDGKEVNGLMKRMKIDAIDKDKETELILSMKHVEI